MPLPFNDWLRAGDPSRPLFLKKGGAVTVRMLAAEAARRLALVERTGWERIAVQSQGAADFLASFAAILCAGRTPVLPGSRRPDDAALGGSADAVLGRGPRGSLPRIDPADSLAAGPSVLPPVPPEAGFVLYTSGSSGTPKEVRKSVGQMDREAEITSALFASRLEGLVFAGTVDPLHMYGLSFLIWLPMALGLPVLARRLEVPEDLAGLTFPSALVTTPTFLHYLEPAPEGPDIRFLLTAGGPLSAGDAGRARSSLGLWADEIYGSTELGAIASRRSCDSPGLARLLPGIAFADAARAIISTPLVPEGRAQLDDLIEPLGGSSFRLIGRRDQIVKVAEHRVSLGEVERAVQLDGREVRALLVVRNGRAAIGLVVSGYPAGPLPGATAAALRRRLLARLPLPAVPRFFRGCPRLPRNAQGKVERERLLELFK
ncbi:MAG: AMP-binding protein [Mesosutterella sp.]|nr:AMP-binding protein [Mesosutterella sp.]